MRRDADDRARVVFPREAWVAVADSYDALAGVYEWLVPEALLTPQGSAAAFADVVDMLPAGARVLDCAAGIGQLAVGLALRGFEVVASDASRAMVERARGTGCPARCRPVGGDVRLGGPWASGLAGIVRRSLLRR
jgi:2-polyprenyl-3-methyl-5-hydroxy-6-metoxy-1,4-benzoquinol methylase